MIDITQMNDFSKFPENYKTMTPDEILFFIRRAIEIAPDEEQRKVHNLILPVVIIDFFKLQNITQSTAFLNGMLLYMYMILWKEKEPFRFNSLEEFFISYEKNHHLYNRRNPSPCDKAKFKQLTNTILQDS